MEKQLNIAIAGLGLIGGGTAKLLQSNAALLQQRAGCKLTLVAVLDRDPSKAEKLGLKNVTWAKSVAELAALPNIDVVVELMGGAEGAARELVSASLKAGKHVVTANKALIAHHGVELAAFAETAGKVLAYEAAVAGGIPVIKAMRESLAANNFSKVAGILNGTCNYILTSMWKDRVDFNTALKEAQRIGYAEANPSFDVDGIDTAHKLAILTSLAFGVKPNIDALYAEGIRNISIADMEFADQLGFTIKLLGLAQSTDAGVLQRVHPALVAKDSALGGVHDAYNGIIAQGDFVGRIIMEGRGAGEGPTASSVVADIIDIARGANYKPFTVPVANLQDSAFAKIDTLKTSYYVRLAVEDKPGVLAAITTGIFSEAGISVDSLIQHSPKPQQPAQIVITTHETIELALQNALKSIAQLKSVIEPARMIRIEGNL